MCSVFGERNVGVWKSGHILFAVFRLPFGCKIPPHHRRNIINVKKITLTDGRKQPTRTRTASATASTRTPASREPCAVFRLSVSRARVSASEYTTHTHHPTHTPPKPTQKQPPKRQAKPPPKTAEKPTQNGGKNNPKKGGYNAPKTHRPKSREL